MADETYSGVMVALIPADSDPIVAASSEPAHMTLAFLGDTQDLMPELVELVLGEVATYAAELDGPIVVPVERIGPLGEDGATVAYLETTDAAWAARQGLLEGAPETSDLAVQHDKFVGKWVPHVTLSYPDHPANGEYAGEAVTFDRIAVWVGDEHHDFAMGGTVSDEIDAETPDQGALLAAARAAVQKFDMAGIVADVDDPISDTIVGESDIDAEMPADELEEGEELVTEVPVHGIATIEGRPTGDGRGFRAGALSFGTLPQPLGYEFEHGHGAANSRVAIIGRIDEFWKVETEEKGVFEARWRGVIFPHKEWGSRAIESIIDGSYTGVSVIIDEVTVDVNEEREALRQRVLRDNAENDGEPKELAALEGRGEMTDDDLELMLDMMVGDGTTPVTWLSAARIRRFDMVPTGAFIEGLTGLGAEFPDEMTEEQLVASAAALEDCGCAESEEEALAMIASAVGFAPGTKDGPGWITHPIPTSRIRRYWVKGEGAAKIAWGTPGDFNRCRAQLAKYVQNPDWLAGLCANMHKEALGIWPGQEGGSKGHSLVASGNLYRMDEAPDAVDARLFDNPGFDGPRGIEVDGERITGYIAVWNVCHIGMGNRCTYAPRSATNYAWFRTGMVRTTEGKIPVGQITMLTGHAGEFLSGAEAAAHYDNTGTVVADVACGEDAYGIWFSGRIRPGVKAEDIYAVEASGIVSGDWRQLGGNYELVGGLVVNVGGYPIPNASLVASASGITAIIGEGMVTPDALVASAAAPADGESILSAEDVTDLAIRAAESYILQVERERTARELAPIRAAFRARQLADARHALAALTEGA